MSTDEHSVPACAQREHRAQDPALLRRWLEEAHARTCELVGDLFEGGTDPKARTPQLEIVNPARWEVGHVAWFSERWVLRQALGDEAEDAQHDAFYDSMVCSHGQRWSERLPPPESALGFLERVHARILERLEAELAEPTRRELLLLALFHQDMHNEAFAYTRQTLGWEATPTLRGDPRPVSREERDRDLALEGGRFRLGADDDAPFAFDNERQAHVVELAPFAIARAPVTQGEFAAFVDAGGYAEPQLWSVQPDAAAPLYWTREDGDPEGRWMRRRFARLEPLEPELPMVHVSWFEAEAFARWAGRRLPSETEWELAARRAPEGWSKPHAYEWTASTFDPYPHFRAGSYAAYSEPWFGTRKVLRGATWLTPSRLVWPSLRNFYEPERRDVWNGFRTAARTG